MCDVKVKKMSGLQLISPPNDSSTTVDLAGASNWMVKGDNITVNASLVDLTSAQCWQVSSNIIYVNACINGVAVLDNVVNLSTQYWNTAASVTNMSDNYWKTKSDVSNLSNNYWISNASLNNTRDIVDSLNNVSNSYLKLSGGSMTGDVSLRSVTEQTCERPGNGLLISLNAVDLNGVVRLSPNQNFSLALTNVPVTTSATRTLTFVYDQKYYFNNLLVNGSPLSLKCNGGLSGVSINTNTSYVMQTLSLCYSASATPIALTSVCCYY